MSLKASEETCFDDENLSRDDSHCGPCSACVSKDFDMASSFLAQEGNRDKAGTRPSKDTDMRSGMFESGEQVMLKRRPFSCKINGGVLFFGILLYLIDDIRGFQIHRHKTILNFRLKNEGIFARSSSSSVAEEIIRPVQPLQSSTKEKRLSVQKAWEQAQVLATQDADSQDDESMSATPFLDLFTDAGIATVKQVPTAKRHTRPKGRPESVPGAMSRATLLNLNDVEARASTISRDFPVMVQHPVSKSSSQISKSSSKVPEIPAPKKRGRGRPRKNKVGNDASVDEITSIAATIAFDKDAEEYKETLDDSSRGVPSVANSSEVTKTRKRRVKILPKSRKMKDGEKDGETTGMMQPTKRGRNGEIEPPNLQRYYRTELLTQEEEYILGMKIQFLMKCEHVHEGLYLETGVAPTLVEWARSCGFTEPDPIRSDPNYTESDADMQIRPLKSEAWDVEPDPNMFVGNGLANDSGPGRGRGRAKKAPPTFLADYYDDSIVKFPPDDGSPKMRKKDLLPINRGSTEDFVEIITTAKEAKQRMVQCNMRLVVSIAKRYKHVGVNIADLVQEGVIGLTRAAEKFDPKKGFKFSTYASW